MTRLRSSMVLLGICVVALLIGALRLATERTPLPTGSSYSAQPDGALALYDWAETMGGGPVRLSDASVLDTAGDSVPATLVVLQPESLLDPPKAGDAFDAVPGHGGTLVVAGDSVSWSLYAQSLGLTVVPTTNRASSASTPDHELTLPITSHYRLTGDGATPLLVAPNGDWVAVRMPYKEGSLVVVATAEPLTNAGLADEQTARFVYREVLASTVGRGVAFDEAHHSFAPPTVGPVTVNQLLFNTAAGRAVIYAAGLVFLYLLLGGRRLGPPIPARPPTETRRTMYEHVQMLANLYRRAGQFAVVRAAFDHHYQRELARGAGGSPKRVAALAEALARIEGARTEAELIGAVVAAQDS